MSYAGFAEIVLALPLNKKFHYSIPQSCSNQIEVGKRVKVPFRGRTIIGYCVGLTDVSDIEKTKEIIQVIDAKPIFTPQLLAISKWMANFYFCGWGEALESFLPFAVRSSFHEKTVSVIRLSKDEAFIKDILATLKKRAPRQASALEVLLREEEMTVRELTRASGCNLQSIYRLRDRELVSLRQRPADSDPVSGGGKREKKTDQLNPTKEQEDAILLIKKRLREGKYRTVLLRGVTGSGKTEVYLQAIAETIALGRKVIVLVPEISLTPQTIERFKLRFDKIAVLHSSLTEKQRNNEWWGIKNGNADIVIGARSALFAPLDNLGLIVIDEEHENTFKQDSSPRYNARDLSLVRAKYENAVVVLGSATPSLESYHNAGLGRYDYVVLKSRIGDKPLPGVQLVDMRHEIQRGKKHSSISKYLELSMKRSLSQKGQVILFLNRRGFSSFISCRRCGFVLTCKKCDISLTYHKSQNAVMCHYCYHKASVPTECPECKCPKINFFGSGTERVEEEIKARFPSYKLLRMDSDTMRGHEAHEKAFSAFKRGDIDILLGTQMIAKGLDIPNVTLVGVLSADTIINLPDFRASERTFQLLCQVAGRTGRGSREGKVIIQTYNPEHYSIIFAASHDYVGFAKKELEYRKQLYYPPYGRMARIVLRGKREEDVKARSLDLAEKLKDTSRLYRKTVEILGPSPAPVTKVKDNYRWHIVVKANTIEYLQQVLQSIKEEPRGSNKVQTVIDVDAYMML
ncbi:MAG: primosomal protein N' [Candidatus Scalindua sp.]|nr:primosomal protein N' [Candidatus Scalindua sp.]